MRSSISTLAVICVLTLASWQFYQLEPSQLTQFINTLSGKPTAQLSGENARTETIDPITDLERYEDADYGFTMSIPAGWSRIVAADIESEDMDDVIALLEPGFAVGFESPRSSGTDRFADYILLEILPGSETGLFESTPENLRHLEIGEIELEYERLTIDPATDDNIDVELVIFQRGVQAFGYTLGFYAIGEPANEQTLFDAFRIMLISFEQLADPFVII